MIRFSPAPGLSLAIVPVLAILLALGVWQVKRLHWKTDLLAQIEQGQALPPTPLSIILEDEKAGKIIAWRKVMVQGSIADEPVRPLYAIRHGKPAQRALAPFINENGTVITVDFGFIDHIIKPDYRLPRTGEMVTLQGILKPVRKVGRFAPANQPDGLWYWPDTATMLSPFFANRAVENYVLDLQAPRLYPDWPVPAPAHAQIPNNHLDYALTWFGLALAALGIYFGWHVRAGRLRFGAGRG
jgi:surfeit locus 1 family protein